MEEIEPGQLVRKMNSGKERKEMMAIHTDTLSNWENFLTPAPISIAILGQLMAIATAKDFSLDASTPIGGFKYLRYPTSFRACLVQISNLGCQAFMKAHKNMDKIRLYAMDFQESVKHVVSIILKGSEEEKTKQLPGMLQELKDNAKKCLELAQESESMFNSVVLLINEVSEASAAVKGVFEKDFEESRKILNYLQKQEKIIEARKKEMEDEKKRAIDELANAKVLLEQSVDKVPGIGTMLISQTVEQGLKIASGALNAFTQCKLVAVSKGVCLLTGLVSSYQSKYEPETDSNQLNTAQKTRHQSNVEQETSVAFKHATEIQTCIEQIYTMLPEKCDTTETAELIFDVEEHKTSLNEINNSLSKIKDDCTKVNSKHEVVISAIEICEKAKVICEELLKKTKKGDIDGFYEKIDKLKNESRRFQLKARTHLSENPYAKLSIGEQKQPKGKRFFEIASENARYEVELRKKELDAAREKNEKMRENARKIDEEQAEVLEELSKTNISTINFENILKTLKRGLTSQSKLKEQWALLVLFFTNIANGIDVCFSQKTDMIDRRLVAGGYNVGDVTRDIVLEMTASVNTVAYSVELIAKAYTDISKRHLVSTTASLGELIAFNPDNEEDKKNMADRRRKIMDDCEAAQAEIRQLAQESRDKMESKIDAMKTRLTTDVEDKLPPITQKKLEVIQEDVAKCSATADDFI